MGDQTMSGFALVTQYMFLVTFLGMASASIYFFVERDSLSPEFRSTATIAGIYTGIAAFIYYQMHLTVGLDGNMETLAKFPTEFRYIDWLVTTPLMLIKFGALLQISDDKRGIVWIMVVADVIMIVTGYFGEYMLNKNGPSFEVWALFALGCLAWLFLLFIMYSSLTEFARDKVAPVKRAFNNMRLFISVGWAIYPIGYMVACFADGDGAKVARELIYNVADLINKVGLGLVVIIAAKQITRDAAIRDAMRRI
jgi:sensory rhodopsin